MGLELISDYGIPPLELRIPVARGLDQWPWIEEGLKHVDTDFYAVLNPPLVGPPLTSPPRNGAWCSEHCWPEREVEGLKERLGEIGIRTYVNRFA